MRLFLCDKIGKERMHNVLIWTVLGDFFAVGSWMALKTTDADGFRKHSSRDAFFTRQRSVDCDMKV